MTKTNSDRTDIAQRVAARPILYWGLRAIAVVSMAAGTYVWPAELSSMSPETLSGTIGAVSPLGWFLCVGSLMHYVQKAAFGIPFFKSYTLYYDFVVAFSALVLKIGADTLMQMT